ncbi:hypothetical protein SAMN05444678_102264 [Sphingomonas sp. YR710]|uniref:tail completion protein gp17 n=1 Tax=Sphingomonas sp. YR710 TaxID=1882773 RepID=UPI0008916A41|nr:hypothetical protein [Sphingomonas sp. YR710]SDC30927.1 hypothetical protein SAMN05444678_102264 [Sphingomonas sp. YR710]
MTDPRAIDYEYQLQKAIFVRLDDQVTGATVHQHVPDKTPMPVVIIGEMNPEDQGVKGAVFDRWAVTINTLTKGPLRSRCTALQAQNRAALDGWKPDPANGVIFGHLYQQNSTAILLPEEEVYVGTQTFTCTTEPV